MASTYMLRPRLLNRVYGISEYQSIGANAERQRQRQRQRQRHIRATGVVRMMIRSKGVYFDYKLKFCLEARTVYILQGSELTEQILVRI